MSAVSPQPEAWLRGPVPGILPALTPVAHAFIQAREDIERAMNGVRPEELWIAPGGAAPAGFHLKHLTGSLDRLLAYARGSALTDAQRETLARERSPGDAPEILAAGAVAGLERALAQVRTTREEDLTVVRPVGRAAFPATVMGLLVHAAEHTTRHVGQLITTLKVVRGLGLADR